ncbi:hypothetical protein BD626DRAFT_419789, partial [Schizophyllum amplum]
FTRFLNHSCEPNIRPVAVYVDAQRISTPLIAFFALRDIQPGEELCISYSGSYKPILVSQSTADETAGNDHFTTAFVCLCGAETCRSRRL